MSLVGFAVDHDPVSLVEDVGGRGLGFALGHAGRRPSVDDLGFHGRLLGFSGDGGRDDQLGWRGSRGRWG